jgi:hypothetical protein
MNVGISMRINSKNETWPGKAGQIVQYSKDKF